MNRLPYEEGIIHYLFLLLNGVPCLKVGIVKCLRRMNLKQLVQV